MLCDGLMRGIVYALIASASNLPYDTSHWVGHMYLI